MKWSWGRRRETNYTCSKTVVNFYMKNLNLRIQPRLLTSYFFICGVSFDSAMKLFQFNCLQNSAIDIFLVGILSVSIN
jgi:hypothetical protein